MFHREVVTNASDSSKRAKRDGQPLAADIGLDRDILSLSVAASDYTVIDKLAVGGTAEIFRASRRLGDGVEIVVIKRLSPHSRADEDLRTLFELEGDLGRRLTHPHIAKLLEIGFDGSDLFIVFEYLDGPNLQRLLDELRGRQRLCPFSLAASILADLLDALDFAHNLQTPSGESVGMVHRDVNPRNVLTSFEGRVALIDFGIARTQGFEGGRPEEIVRGKLGSIAPEQLRREPLDHRADLFAAGALAYELLIGSHPFKHAGTPEEQVLEAILTGDFIPCARIAPELPKPVCEMIDAALSPRVERRPTSGAEMSAVLAPHREAQAQTTLAQILRTLFPSQLASVESLRYLAGA